MSVLLAENFDGFVVEGENPIAMEQATNARQHFPSLKIVCLSPKTKDAETPRRSSSKKSPESRATAANGACASNCTPLSTPSPRAARPPKESIPAIRLIGNLNQFSAAEILQMSCLGQRSGRFTFKSGRGNSEIYLAHGSVRHAVFGSLEGESAVAEIFRWRQGRFYFEEGIISQVQTVGSAMGASADR